MGTEAFAVSECVSVCQYENGADGWAFYEGICLFLPDICHGDEGRMGVCEAVTGDGTGGVPKVL